MGERDIKEFLYAFLMKNYRIPPVYDVKSLGDQNGYYCELRVNGFHYVATGRSTSKRNAQTSAANSFVAHLVYKGAIKAEEIPNRNALSIVRQRGLHASSGNDTATSGRYVHRTDEDSRLGREPAPFSVGGYSAENAKAKLHPFLMENRIQTDYVYESYGPDHHKNFFAEMSFIFRGREIYAREKGWTKALASKSCALSIVRQLYEMKFIGPSGTTVGTKKNQVETKPFPVILRDELEKELNKTIVEFRLLPSIVRRNSIEPQTLLDERLAPKAMRLGDEGDSRCSSIDIPWSPPTANWNTWTASTIERGYFATVSMNTISQDLWQRQERRIQSDVSLQKALEERKALPIYAFKNAVMDALYNHSVVVIRGNTGSGKSTQVCQYILDDYLRWKEGAQCSVIVTQPRRISAISVAERVASERREEVGESVGFSVRFESTLPRPYGSILFCTVGVLLRRLERGLHGVSHVIVDEVHERDTNTDFLLIMLRDLVYRHPELRVILMSATIDTSLFSRYFGRCPVVDIPGRVHPVQLYYLEDCVEMLRFRPRQEVKKNYQRKDDEEEENMNLKVIGKYSPETKNTMALLNEKEICLELVEELLIHIRQMKIPGAVLVFLPGWSTIFALLRHLQQSRYASDYLLLPLHSMLPREDQRRVFQPAPERRMKVILATNIAESSITIDDVVFVIDSCLANIKLFTSHNNMHNYATVWAAQDNLEQRRGRAGRVRPGYAFRLCSYSRYQHLEKSLKAEILRSPLHETALAIKLLRLGSIAHFLSKAIEPPPIDAIIEAEVMLREMKCLDAQEELTALGRLVARIPVEPSLAKMIIVGALFGHGDAMCILAAGESVSADVFYLGLNKRLNNTQRSFAGHRCSDHVAMLSAFYAYDQVRIDSGPRSLHSFCDANGLSYSTLRALYDARCQLRDILLSFGFPKSCFTPKAYRVNGNDPELDTVIGLIGIGHYPNICVHREKRKVQMAEARLGPSLIHKSSVNCIDSSDEIEFPLPFFVFSEKIRAGTVVCKNVTLVTPLHLILFGAKRVQIIPESGMYLVRLDGWINLQINPQTVANMLALKPALDEIIARLSADPESVTTFTQSPLVNMISRLCEFHAAEYPSSPASQNYKRPSDEGSDSEVKFGRFENRAACYRPSLVSQNNSSRRNESTYSKSNAPGYAGQRGVNGNWRATPEYVRKQDSF
ncbi:dosage compensation regulator [Daphnia magna]|uniref:RNA helicase n=1 Tax=Daphnia magna TaxID=35525 RepID=A0ABR0AWX0_9CRUS|nr:dosage compensation regulator [Daphnia magna]XP_032793616.2 dosage compensation regulator [Daphnia magna]XP_045034996.1 dosage compensation regulator [Daphnia magna]XP_045034997.1 dosage compensation regulator [Daphnia magna]XP_045034998.1 dosage compensation regulator [Daphnia magna]XP_045034999.1 dosage compensation regulator [Daphnia magna]KAK4029626.1 hypothetical protein OUZ56_022598 [Daphnia magna]